MISIYKLEVNSTKGKRPYVLTEEDDDGYKPSPFDGPLPADWNPPKFDIHRRSGRLADALSWQAEPPLLSERAVQLFSQTAPDCAEYRFFAEIKGKPYFVMNVLATESVSILDQERSEFARKPDGDIGQVYRYVVKIDKQRKLPPMFRITFESYLDSTILVTDAIPHMVVVEGLTGFEFRDPDNPTEMKDLYVGKDLNIYPGVLP